MYVHNTKTFTVPLKADPESIQVIESSIHTCNFELTCSASNNFASSCYIKLPWSILLLRVYRTTNNLKFLYV